MIKLIGKKIVSGDLNLTRISFPIKAMVPKTELENSTMACIFYYKQRLHTALLHEKGSIIKGSCLKNEIRDVSSIFGFLLPEPILKASNIFELNRSLIQSSERLLKDTTRMEQKSTVSKYHIILLSVTF
jgi:hypothetical protein